MQCVVSTAGDATSNVQVAYDVRSVRSWQNMQCARQKVCSVQSVRCTNCALHSVPSAQGAVCLVRRVQWSDGWCSVPRVVCNMQSGQYVLCRVSGMQRPTATFAISLKQHKTTCLSIPHSMGHFGNPFSVPKRPLFEPLCEVAGASMDQKQLKMA